ncbi:hypothetical protein KC217_22140, partial [Mycobacterium tuberculosis]|nr:hypothetical protein [Mycobacterium tuberculosis]
RPSDRFPAKSRRPDRGTAAQNRIRFCDDETKKKYLTKRKDPLLNGPFRGQIKNGFSTSIQNEKTYRAVSALVDDAVPLVLLADG